MPNQLYFASGVTSQRYGDIYNLFKEIFDGLMGIIWAEDKQISRMLVTKDIETTLHIDFLIEERRSESAMAKESGV